MKIVYFAGGPGTRFWPISRKQNPKQLIPLFNGKSTMRMHMENMFPHYGWNNILITTTELLAARIKEEFPALPLTNLITEPSRRDLGPAVGLTMMKLRKLGAGREPIAILWSDGFLGNFPELREFLQTGEQLIKEDPDRIIFIGEKPQFANENVGWIETGEKLDTAQGKDVFKLVSFHYRPRLELAKSWFKGGTHLINTGYFITTPEFILKEYQRSAPEIYKQLQQIEAALDTGDENEVLQKIYAEMPVTTFDNIVLEGLKPESAMVLGGSFKWTDPGTLYALKQFLTENKEDANAVKGKVLPKKTRDSLLFNYVDKQLLVTIGLDGYVVVNTPDAILVAQKDEIKEISHILKEFEGTELEKYL
jgi:mannose-1-phosphate guanylyltransferase